jgi:hypothetical protein
MGLEGPSLEPAEIKVRANPLPPYIQSPADGEDIRGKSLRFEWLKVKQAVKYHLQVAEDDQFQTLVADNRDIIAVSSRIGSLDFKTYYFRIRSVAADGYEGIWSDTLSFNIIPPPPSPPVEKPEVGDKELRVRWRNLGDGITYHFQMAKDQAFTDVLMDEKLAKPEITFEKPSAVGTYYIRTSGIDSHGYEGEFSEPQSFEVKNYVFLIPGGMILMVLLAVIIF